MAQADVYLALWLGRAVSDQSGSLTQTMVVDDIAERVDAGETYKSAIEAVTAHDSAAGDFGVEIVGSMIGIAVVEGLKAFFAAYAKELEEKAGKTLADMSVDWIKSRFKHDAVGPDALALQTKMSASITAAGAAREVTPADLAPSSLRSRPLSRRTVLRRPESMSMALVSPAGATAVDIELQIYKAVLAFIVLPVFGLFIPVYFLQAAVVDAYRIVRRLAALLFNVTLEPVEQIRFEGHAFFIAASLVMLALVAAFLIGFRWRLSQSAPGRSLPDAPQRRRFKALPVALKEPIAVRLSHLWRMIAPTGSALPEAQYYASTGVAACVVETALGPGVALSSALLESMIAGPTVLADVILLHEMAHLIGRDGRFFRTCTAFVSTFRIIFLGLVVTLGVIAFVSAIFEMTNIAGIEVRRPSIYAFAIDGVRDLLFPFAGMVLVLRYIGLLTMLTELRADLRAAAASVALRSLPRVAGRQRLAASLVCRDLADPGRDPGYPSDRRRPPGTDGGPQSPSDPQISLLRLVDHPVPVAAYRGLDSIYRLRRRTGAGHHRDDRRPKRDDGGHVDHSRYRASAASGVGPAGGHGPGRGRRKHGATLQAVGCEGHH